MSINRPMMRSGRRSATSSSSGLARYSASGFPGEGGEVCEVARDQEGLAVDEGSVDHGAESRS